MSERVWVSGADMSISINADGTYTACCLGMQTVCETFAEAVVWCCSVRDKGGEL